MNNKHSVSNDYRAYRSYYKINNYVADDKFQRIVNHHQKLLKRIDQEMKEFIANLIEPSPSAVPPVSSVSSACTPSQGSKVSCYICKINAAHNVKEPCPIVAHNQGCELCNGTCSKVKKFTSLSSNNSATTATTKKPPLKTYKRKLVPVVTSTTSTNKENIEETGTSSKSADKQNKSMKNKRTSETSTVIKKKK